MRFFALATDYDGTIAQQGVVPDSTVAALQRLIDTGRRLILVTGRELDELLEICPAIEIFEWVVAENGALLYRPSNREEKLLAEPPSADFVAALHRRGVAPLSVGRSIVATWEPHQTTVLEVIREQGLELQVIFNKGAVMVLPASVNKASGLQAALQQMNLTAHEVIGVGDAENDHAFLSVCEASAAVSNALPSLKDRVQIQLTGDHGAGVEQLVEELIASDLANFRVQLENRNLVIGASRSGEPIAIPSFGRNVLIAGPSGSGKSTTTTTILEQLVEQHYQFCVIDPEGDYESLDFAVVIGSGERGPAVAEVEQVLSHSEQSIIVNLIGLKLSERPEFFTRLLPLLLGQRERCGRPHWLIVDEAHHLLPPSWQLGSSLAEVCERTVYVTVHPEQIHADVLKSVDIVIAVGPHPWQTFQAFSQAQGASLPFQELENPGDGEVWLWDRTAGTAPVQLRITPNTAERRRHIRKYAEGELPPERSFYFRGPQGKLQLRAQNLILFLQLAEGVDDETWEFHRQQGDYSHWIRECIKDDVLAQSVAGIESRSDTDPHAAREEIRAAIEQRYTLPATALRLSQDRDLTANPTP